MPGLWEWLDSTVAALFNLQSPSIKGEVAPTPTGADTFVIGTARPFGKDAPREGDITILFNQTAKHVVFQGGSGSGKSSSTHRLRDGLVAANMNCIDIDFRGDGYDRACVRLMAAGVPPERTTLIDLRDRDRVVPLNFLGFGPGDAQSRAAVVHTAIKEHSPSWGVRLDGDSRATLIAIAEDRGSLLDVSLILSPEGSAKRQELLARTNDDYVREFLTTYDALSPEDQRSRASAVTNKLDVYLHHPVLRASFALPGAPDMRQIMDEVGHVSLVALGADRNPQAGLVGRMLVAAIQRAAMARVDVHESKRTNCRLIVDEAQNLLGEESCQILAEGRRFKLGLVLCSQFGGQFQAELRASIKVNCATQVYFHTSASEASEIAGEIVSSLTREEIRKVLLTAPVGAAIVVRRGEPAAFVTTPDSPDPKVDPDDLAEFKREIKARTTIPWAEAEAHLAARSVRPQEIQQEVRDVRKPFNRRKTQSDQP